MVSNLGRTFRCGRLAGLLDRPYSNGFMRHTGLGRLVRPLAPAQETCVLSSTHRIVDMGSPRIRRKAIVSFLLANQRDQARGKHTLSSLGPTGGGNAILRLGQGSRQISKRGAGGASLSLTLIECGSCFDDTWSHDQISLTA